MRTILCLVVATAALASIAPAAAAERPAPMPAVHDELRRSLEELSGHLHGLGARWREHFTPVEDGAERPLITIALAHRAELALSPRQVEALERLRSDFQREAIRRDADLRIAEMDLAALRRADSVDMAQVEARVREAEKVRADLRVARIRTLEAGKAQLTPEQREKLRALLADPHSPTRPRTGGGPVPPPPPRERL
jgi:Spy/CpxP family protein refolding chaperone